MPFRPLLLVLLALLIRAAPCTAGEVALTFDDLPTLQLTNETDYARHSTHKLLAALKQYRVPAIGFVNEGKLEGSDQGRRIDLLRQWIDAGMDLGNHGYSHLSLTTTQVDAYEADVAKGDRVTRGLLAVRGRAPRWFRHPYLETGPTIDIRYQFEGWLGDHGYRVAPVTMENSDWTFALPYDAAIQSGNKPEARRIRQAYLDYSARIIEWYRTAASDLLGYEPPFVFLLHATRLNADSFGGFMRILGRNHLHAISLDKAVRDPAYATREFYAGPEGMTWLTRWSLAMKKDLPWASLPKMPADLQARSDSLDSVDITTVAAAAN